MIDRTHISGFNESFPCPKCGDRRNCVIDSRERGPDSPRYRRRECVAGHRFTTYERIDPRCEPPRDPVEIVSGVFA